MAALRETHVHQNAIDAQMPAASHHVDFPWSPTGLDNGVCGNHVVHPWLQPMTQAVGLWTLDANADAALSVVSTDYLDQHDPIQLVPDKMQKEGIWGLHRR